MAKLATVQVRMDAELKQQVEELYRSMGTSFAEAVRIFARQSIEENAMPFVMHVPKQKVRGMAAKYANPDITIQEEGAFERMVVEHHETDY